MYGCVCQCRFSFHLDKYLGVGLLGSIWVFCLFALALVFNFSHWCKCWWYIIVILICSLLMTHVVEHLLMCSFATISLPLWIVYIDLLPSFYLVVEFWEFFIYLVYKSMATTLKWVPALFYSRICLLLLMLSVKGALYH